MNQNEYKKALINAVLSFFSVLIISWILSEIFL